MATLSDTNWDERFTIIPGADQETIRDDVEDVEDIHTLWTVIDVDGKLYVVTGRHFVNRMGYVVTEEAWETADESNEWEW